MIVAMKKIAVLAQEKDSKSAVEVLRKLGVVHVENIQAPHGEALKSLREDIALVDAAISILSEEKFVKTTADTKQEAIKDWRFIAAHVIDLNKHLKQLEEYSWQLKIQIGDWQRWGDFEPEAITSLYGKNIFIRLYQIPLKELKTLPAGLIIKNIFTSAGLAHCVVISRKNIEIPFKEVALPKLGLEKMRSRLFEDARMMGIIKDDICKHASMRQSLEAVQNSLIGELEFGEALAGMGKDGLITYLTGFVPVDVLELVKTQAQKERWGLKITDPLPEDNVPTLLKNPRWIALIMPVMNFLGVLPGYKEIDVSPLFLIFFGMFFGILIGDAGYGLVYLTLTFLLQRKHRGSAKGKVAFNLLYVLSSCAIVWGILTGTFFGQGWLAARGVRPLVPALNDRNIMQTICFFIGALHLSIAHAWRALLKFPSLAFLADLGWIAVLWVAYFLAGSLILGRPFPSSGLAFAVAGIVLILFFSEPRKNVFKRLAAGFNSVTFGLSFMSAFTDVVSYVRLFAVGLAAVAIADTTNFMASTLGTGPVAFFAGILVVLAGHTLNVVLGPIAILVHGVRLNVLEFGLNHGGITWSGAVYKPLTKEVS